MVPDSLRPHGLQPTRLLCPWDFPGKDDGVSCHFLLQRILPTQGSNPGLLHCRQILYQVSYKGSPKTFLWAHVFGGGAARILKWVAIPFSRRSSRPRDRTQVSHLVGRHFAIWATKEFLIFKHFYWICVFKHQGFPGASDDKESACTAGDLGSIPGLGRFSGEGNDYSPQYFAWRIPWTEEPGRL